MKDFKTKIKNFLNARLYFTKDFPGKEIKRYKLSYLKASLYLFSFTVFIFALVLILLSLITPLRNSIFVFENSKLKEQAKQIQKLELQVAYLSKELNKFIELKRKLNFAIQLAESDSLDSTSAIYDSLRKVKYPNRLNGGNLFYIVEHFLEKNFHSETKFLQSKSDDNFYFLSPVNKAIIVRKFDKESNHLGIDFAVKPNSPVYAPAPGYVIFSGFTAVDGNIIILQHDKNFRTVLKHCSVILKNTGDKVYRGEIIAYSGNSGINTTGPHLHFEIWQGDRVLNPEKYLIH